jgi:hypothetical protein
MRSRTIGSRLLIIAAATLAIAIAGSAEAKHGGEGGHGGDWGWHGGEGGHGGGGWHGGIGWHDNGRHLGWFKQGWSSPGWRGPIASDHGWHEWRGPGFVDPGAGWSNWRHTRGWGGFGWGGLLVHGPGAASWSVPRSASSSPHRWFLYPRRSTRRPRQSSPDFRIFARHLSRPPRYQLSLLSQRRRSLLRLLARSLALRCRHQLWCFRRPKSSLQWHRP